MTNPTEKLLQEAVIRHAREVTYGINQELGRPLEYDQTNGNRCDLLTHFVMGRLLNDGYVDARRELHIDAGNNWHFLIAHTGLNAVPTNNDVISDLNPWQWRNFGGEILHGPRHKVMQELRLNNAPESFIALRGLNTLKSAHHEPINPFKS